MKRIHRLFLSLVLAWPSLLWGADFYLVVEDVFAITGRNIVVTGKVGRGLVEKGQTVTVLGFGPSLETKVTAIEKFRKQLDRAKEGDNVGLYLESLTKSQIKRGQVLVAKGSMAAYQKFKADITMTPTQDGGRGKPISDGYKPQVTFWNVGFVSGTVTLEKGQSVKPGGKANVVMNLAQTVAMEKGSKFFLREGARRVGTGVVTELIPLTASTNFSVVLKSFGTKKIRVIKAVREITGKGLLATKNLVESAPVVVKKGVSASEAEGMVSKLRKAGAQAEVQ